MAISRHQLIKYLILLSLLIAVSVFFIAPYFNNIKKISVELKNEAASLASQYQSGDDVEKANATYEYFKNQLPDLKTLFLKKGEELTLITQLEQLAGKYNLEQDLALSLEGQELNSALKKVPFIFTVKGDFNNFMSYLDKLAKLNYNLTIHSLNLRQLDGQIIEAKLNGYTYWHTL